MEKNEIRLYGRATALAWRFVALGSCAATTEAWSRRSNANAAIAFNGAAMGRDRRCRAEPLSTFHANADCVNWFRLGFVEDCSREKPHHAGARIDVAAIVADVRRYLARIRRNRRCVAVDDIFRERAGVLKKDIPYPELGLLVLLIEGQAGEHAGMDVIAQIVFKARWKLAHPFLRPLERGRGAQGGNSCVPAIDEEVSAARFRFRGAKHQLFMIAAKTNRPLRLKPLRDFEHLARLRPAVDIVAEKNESMRIAHAIGLEPSVDPTKQNFELSGHSMNISNCDSKHFCPFNWSFRTALRRLLVEQFDAIGRNVVAAMIRLFSQDCAFFDQLRGCAAILWRVTFSNLMEC